MIKQLLTALLTLVFVVFGAAGAASANGNHNGHHPVTFCHVKSNPPQTMTTDKAGWEHGHKQHGDYLGECVPSEPVIVDFDESECVGTTQWRTHTWQEIDGVVSNVVDVTVPLTQDEAIAKGCYTAPPVLECEEWTVPGVLDEYGNPTSCVSNHPCPGLEAPACEVPQPPVDKEEPPIVDKPKSVNQPHLAETGGADWIAGGFGLGFLLLAAGARLVSKRLGA